MENLTASAEKGILRLAGRVRADLPPCALIASVWPTTDRTDHGAMTFCAAVDDDGKFSVEITNLNAPSWHLKLGCLLANGAEWNRTFSFRCNARGEPDAAEFIAASTQEDAEQTLMRDPARAAKLLTAEAIGAAPTEETSRRLRLLRTMSEPEPEPVDLANSAATRAFLSDARWTKAEVGWGKVARNRYWFNEGAWEGMLLKLNGTVFAKGIYAHAKSEFIFPLGGKWKTFTATIGLRDGAADQGSAIFRVSGDGQELFRSKLLRPGQMETVRLEIPDIEQLELHAEGGEGHNHNSWAIWADPVVEK